MILTKYSSNLCHNYNTCQATYRDNIYLSLYNLIYHLNIARNTKNININQTPTHDNRYSQIVYSGFSFDDRSITTLERNRISHTCTRTRPRTGCMYSEVKILANSSFYWFSKLSNS